MGFPLYSVNTDCQAYCMQHRVRALLSLHALLSAINISADVSSAWSERPGEREKKEEGRPSREEQARRESGREQGRMIART